MWYRLVTVHKAIPKHERQSKNPKYVIDIGPKAIEKYQEIYNSKMIQDTGINAWVVKELPIDIQLHSLSSKYTGECK